MRIIGFKSLPKAGDPVICVESEEMAEELVERREVLGMSNTSSRPDAPSAKDSEVQVHGMRTGDSRRMQRLNDRVADLRDAADSSGDSDSTRIPVVIKADADGSLAAVTEALVCAITLEIDSTESIYEDGSFSCSMYIYKDDFIEFPMSLRKNGVRMEVSQH